MLGFGMGEILIIAVVVLIVVGPDKLPQFARNAGRLYGQVRRTADEMRRALVLEADRQDADDRYDKMRERRKKAEAEREAAEAANPGVTAQDEHLPGAPPATPIVKDSDVEDANVEHPEGDHGDADLQALLNDPNGPYAAGRSLDEVELDRIANEVHAQQPAVQSDEQAVVPAPAPALTRPLPPGVTAEEWADLPDHIRNLLSAGSAEDRA